MPSLTVSVGWRGSFNQNWMWWQHCNADTAEYVETAECRVEPRFESPESEDSTLTYLYKRAGDNEMSLKRIFVETGMDLLEVLNKIAENRTLYVLAASTTVSTDWRRLFNSNVVGALLGCASTWRLRNEELSQETGMDLFPLEALNIIAENQTLYVLAASSSCNADTAEYLETSECWVNPRFESQESEDSTQTSLYKKAEDKEISIYELLLVV
ncbi:hypothetical protein J6590_091180 [Homalodisca vitripennis]|nr:hypothetical protein J6590_091180 [Homalodisca vitripennis]